MADDRQTLPKSAASAFSIWDAVNIFEYTTSRITTIHLAVLKDDIAHSNSYQHSFVRYMVWEAEHFVTPFVNMCAAMNISTTMLPYLSEVLLLITSFQTKLYNHSKFFATYEACPHQPANHPIDINWVVPNYKHAWWMYQFELLPFNMPPQILVSEVKMLVAVHFAQQPRMALMVPRPIAHARSDYPLMQQLQVLQTKVAHLVAAFNHLEDPVDELCEAMEASHVAVAVLQEDYNNGRLGGSPSIKPFPHPARLPH
ncbi:hypothetical protein BDR03DRAFT_1008805 [Suillus americanus]|nr:hypothetical protein BDR03DRAFT_1008805 [Suillus americanus]